MNPLEFVKFLNCFKHGWALKSLEHNVKLNSKYCTTVTKNHQSNSQNSHLNNSGATRKKQGFNYTKRETNKHFHGHPDRFGTLSQDRLMRQTMDHIEEDDDIEEKSYIDGIEGKRRRKDIHYAMMIKQLLNENKLGEALYLVDKTMLEEDGAKPDLYIYNLLISGCARQGYTKKAFHLFNKMKKQGIRPRLSTYTSLFNACSEGPWENDSLSRARHLREHMLEKGVQPNLINYHAMIKAFGRQGDLETSFSIVDEMTDKNIAISSITFNFLLHAAISDKEAGFRHAILVLRKMLEKKIMPTLFTYNLLLRCIRDCGVGDSQSTQDFFNMFSQFQRPQIEASKDDPKKEVAENPNLLLTVPQCGSLVAVTSKIDKPWHRLMLVGNMDGLLMMMDASKVKPDIKTFTQLINILPQSTSIEEDLLSQMRKRKIKFDIDFCNILIRKRNLSSRFAPAKEVLNLIKDKRLKPNIMTFGVLALGCNSLQTTKDLIKDIEDVGFRVNIEILTAFLKKAEGSFDIDTILFVIKKLLLEEVRPDPKMFKRLVSIKDTIQSNLELKERGSKSYYARIDDPGFKEKFSKLTLKIEELQDLVVDISKIHPWKQFSIPEKET